MNKTFFKIFAPVSAACLSVSSFLLTASAEEGVQLPLPGDIGQEIGSEVGASSWHGWSALISQHDLSAILDGVEQMLPTLLPIVVGFVGIRKALSFLFSSLRKA